MNYVDITPYIKPERVLNFNFSTNMLLRCIDKKYARTFLKGKIRFSKPLDWIKEEEQKGSKGRGDRLEGTFFSTKNNDNSDFIKNLKKVNDINNFEQDGFTYFRKKSIEKLYCLCFYGVNDNSFDTRKIDKDGKAHYSSCIKKEYFKAFSENISKEEYLMENEEDRPSVIFISNPKELFKRIRNFFQI